MARYSCDDPAFTGDFVEFSDSWSRAQVRATWDAIPTSAADGEGAEERLLACLRQKVLAVHLTCVDAEPITQAADLTEARTEQMDTRLFAWWANVWIVHLRSLADLGNALGGQLLLTFASSKAATKPTAAKTATRHRQKR